MKPPHVAAELGRVERALEGQRVESAEEGRAERAENGSLLRGLGCAAPTPGASGSASIINSASSSLQTGSFGQSSGCRAQGEGRASSIEQRTCGSRYPDSRKRAMTAYCPRTRGRAGWRTALP